MKAYDRPKGWWWWDENSQGSFDKKSDRMAFTRVKTGNGFIFRQAWTIGNYAWIQFHVYTSLKWKTMPKFSFIFTQAWNEKLCLGLVCMPPTWWLNSRCMPPKLHYIHLSRLLWLSGGWNEGSFTRSSERLDWDFTISNQRLELEGDLFHFLMSLTQEKNHYHGDLFHCLTRLT